jgi:hypothetical protein
MASLQATYSGDLTSSIAGQLVDIISTAASRGRTAKTAATLAAAKYKVDPKFTPGEFTAREGRNYIIEKTLGKRFVPKTSVNDILARGQSSSDPLMGTPAHVRNLPEYQQLANPAEKKFKENSSKLTGTVPSNDKPVKVQDKKLGKFLSAAVEAINQNFSTLSDSLDDAQSEVIQAKEGIFGTIKQLEQNSDLLETKLDAIIDALRDQNDTAKKQTDIEQVRAKAAEQGKETDQSGTLRLQDIGQSKQEAIQLNLLQDEQEIGKTPETQDQQLSLPIPELEEGGIMSGPDSGYLAKLHGNEMIVPLDNNFTQGEPSAVDGKVRPKPQTSAIPSSRVPKTGGVSMYEQGSDEASDPSFSPNILNAMISMQDSAVPAKIDKKNKDLQKAMELPLRASGVMTLSMLEKAVSGMGTLAAPITSELKQIANPIASAFGVPNTIADKVIKDTSHKKDQEDRQKQMFASGSASSSKSERAWWDPLGVFTGRGGIGGDSSKTIYSRPTGGTGGSSMQYGSRQGGTGGPFGFLPGTGRVMTPSAGDNGSYMQDGRTVQKFLGMEVPFSAKRSGYTPEDVQRYNSQDSGTQMQTYDAVPHPSRKDLAERMRQEYNINISDPAYKTRSVQPQVTPQSTTTGNRRLDGAIRNAQDIGDMTGTRGLMDQTATIAEKTQRRNDILRQYMRDAGMSGADESMNMYGKPMGDQSSINSPASRGAISTVVNMQSQQNSLRKMETKNKTLEPILISNSSQIDDTADDTPPSYISTKGDIGFSELYPSLYS